MARIDDSMNEHEHHVDMQGLCHGCGALLDEASWDAYSGYDREHWMRQAMLLFASPFAMNFAHEYKACLAECELRKITVSELLTFAKRKRQRA